MLVYSLKSILFILFSSSSVILFLSPAQQVAADGFPFLSLVLLMVSSSCAKATQEKTVTGDQGKDEILETMCNELAIFLILKWLLQRQNDFGASRRQKNGKKKKQRTSAISLRLNQVKLAIIKLAKMENLLASTYTEIQINYLLLNHSHSIKPVLILFNSSSCCCNTIISLWG